MVARVVVAESAAQRVVAAHSAAGRQRDLQQFTWREDTLDVLRTDQDLGAT